MTNHDLLTVHLLTRHDAGPAAIPDDFEDVVAFHRVFHDTEMCDHDFQRIPDRG